MCVCKALPIVLAVLLTLLFSIPLSAREATRLESVTVTANKMEEDVQDVSTSITVFSAEDIEDFDIESIADVAVFTPNFMVYEMGVSGTNAPAMRGLYADIHSHSVSAAMYVDGVPFLDGMGYEQDMLDIERIEVLKGPQGTLYGKSAEAGVINIITRQPGNTLAGKVSGKIGGDGKREVSMTLSGPVKKDTLYLGISGLYDQKDGWVERAGSDDTLDDTKRYYGSTKLRYTPTEVLDITLKGTFLKYDDDQPHYNLSPLTAVMYGLDTPQYRKTDPDLEGYNQTETHSESLHMDWDVTQNLKLTSTTAYRKQNYDSAADYDFHQPTFLHFYNDNRISKLSQELRLSASMSRIQWVAGIYGDKDKVVSDYRLESFIPGMAMETENELKGKAGAVFGHVGIPLGDKLKLLGGLRYDYQEKEFDAPDDDVLLDNDWDEFSPKIGLEYNVTPSTMTYATVSKGYLSGGFNPYADDPQYLSYDEEKLWSYEIGVKNTFFDDKLRLNAAVYFMDIDDVQVQQSIDTARSYTTNSAKASARGAEIEFTALPVAGLTLMAGFGYSDVEFDEYEDAIGDYEGNQKPFSPEYTFNVGAQYRSGGGFYCRADITGYGAMYTDRANEYKRDPYELVNAKIGYETETFDVYLYGKNIFDTEYDSIYDDGLYINYSEPAEFGVAMAYRF
jgi:iron complex outermembrane receptor protein